MPQGLPHALAAPRRNSLYTEHGHVRAWGVQVQTLLLFWEKKYKPVWDQDKDAFMRSALSRRRLTACQTHPLACRGCLVLRTPASVPRLSGGEPL